jgi:fucokinase
MDRMPQPWDYLVVTASNAAQADSYERQLRLRRETGLLSQAREVLVVPDPGGRRAGSGGSTLFCLADIINRQQLPDARTSADQPPPEDVLRRLRILIIHAGGDSKRLPAYGPCGKLFVPLPGETCSALGWTLFDRMASTLLSLPAREQGAGQVVVASGDALLLFDPDAFQPAPGGVTALGSYAQPEAARRHGVFSVAGDGTLRLYLQKPSPEEQQRMGAGDRSQRSVLDLGLMSFDAATAAAWLKAFDFGYGPDAAFGCTAAMREEILGRSLDLYREICCAMGAEATPEHYLAATRASGSSWGEQALAALFPALHRVPMRVSVARRCGFLHFGTTRQLVDSGLALLEHDQGTAPASSRIIVNCEVGSGVAVTGSRAWIEGCRIKASVSFGGGNVLVGVDVTEPLALPAEACLDVWPGSSRHGTPVCFVRCHGFRDAFKDKVGAGALFCGKPLLEWLGVVGAKPEDVWSGDVSLEDRTLWDARVSPAERSSAEYRNWLWMYDPGSATAAQRLAWLAADRYSAAEIALRSDQSAFHDRRAAIREKAVPPASRRQR